MAIAFVKRMTPGTQVGAGTTVAATVPAAGVAIGNRLLVAFVSNNSSGDADPTCADSKGNVYALDEVHSAASRRVCVFSAPVTVGLVQNDTITVTFTSTIRAAIDVLEFSGINGKETSTKNSGSGTGVGSGATAQRLTANALLFGVVGWNAAGAGEVFTAGATFTGGATVEPLSPNTWRDLGTEYRIVSATGTEQADGTIGSATTYGMIEVVYPMTGDATLTVAPQWGQAMASTASRVFTPRVRGDDLVEPGHAVNTNPYVDTSEG